MTLFEYRARVERVVDGDTIRLRVDCGFDTWHVGSFRLLGAAARELAQPGGAEACRHLAELLPPGLPVQIRSVKPDKYGGRYDASVTLPDGTDLATLLIGEGWAVPWDGRGKPSAPPWPRPAVEGTQPEETP